MTPLLLHAMESYAALDLTDVIWESMNTVDWRVLHQSSLSSAEGTYLDISIIP